MVQKCNSYENPIVSHKLPQKHFVYQFFLDFSQQIPTKTFCLSFFSDFSPNHCVSSIFSRSAYVVVELISYVQGHVNLDIITT